MKDRFLMLLLAEIFAFCSLSVWADEDPCNTTLPEPPDPNPSDCIAIELGE